MSSGKKRLIAIFLLLLAIAVPASVYLVLQQQEIRGRAEPATTLSFDPVTLTRAVGDTFTLNIMIDTGTNSVSGAELHIQYDATKLTAIAIDIAPMPFLPRVLVQGSAQGGFAFITLGAQPSQPQLGTGTLATLTFRATASTAGAPTFVRFTTDTAVAGTGEIGNVLASQPAPASIVIGTAATPTPTASTPTPTTAAGAPTATPGSGGGGSGGGGSGTGGSAITPTPTRTATSSASTSASPSATPIATAKGGSISAQPTSAAIPVTADLGPTAVITVGGIALTVLGIVSLLAL